MNRDVINPLKAVFDYAQEHHVSIQVAALAVLPTWLDQYPEHVDADDARWFLQKAHNNFGQQERS